MDEDRLLSDLTALTAEANVLLGRVTVLLERARNIPDAPKVEIDQHRLDHVSALLDGFNGATVTSLQTISFDWSWVNVIDERVENILTKISELPEELKSTLEAQVLSFQEEFADRTAVFTEDIGPHFSSVLQRAQDSVDHTFNELLDEMGNLSERIEEALNGLKEGVSTADREITRILDALERTRHTVLNACRLASTGAEAAAPAVEVASAAFSAVG